MDSIYRSLSVSYGGSTSTELPVAMPQAVPESVTRRVFVMDFLEGDPLLRMQEKMESKGITPGYVRANFLGWADGSGDDSS
jgi:pantothenate kinase